MTLRGPRCFLSEKIALVSGTRNLDTHHLLHALSEDVALESPYGRIQRHNQVRDTDRNLNVPFHDGIWSSHVQKLECTSDIYDFDPRLLQLVLDVEEAHTGGRDLDPNSVGSQLEDKLVQEATASLKSCWWYKGDNLEDMCVVD